MRCFAVLFVSGFNKLSCEAMEKLVEMLKTEILSLGGTLPANPKVLEDRLKRGGDMDVMAWDIILQAAPSSRSMLSSKPSKLCCEAKDRARRKILKDYVELLEEYGKVLFRLERELPQDTGIAQTMRFILAARVKHHCYICEEIDQSLTPENLGVLPCGHLFHQACLGRIRYCPFCRASAGAFAGAPSASGSGC
jgi:hypothetical protein